MNAISSAMWDLHRDLIVCSFQFPSSYHRSQHGIFKFVRGSTTFIIREFSEWMIEIWNCIHFNIVEKVTEMCSKDMMRNEKMKFNIGFCSDCDATERGINEWNERDHHVSSCLSTFYALVLENFLHFSAHRRCRFCCLRLLFFTRYDSTLNICICIIPEANFLHTSHSIHLLCSLSFIHTKSMREMWNAKILMPSRVVGERFQVRILKYFAIRTNLYFAL